MVAWISAHLVPIIAAVIAAILGYRNKDAIQAKIPSWVPVIGAKKVADGTEPVIVTDETNVISQLLDRLSNMPILQRLEISRDILIRWFLSLALIKLVEYVKTLDLPEDKLANNLAALDIVSSTVMVQGNLKKPEVQQPAQSVVVQQPAPVAKPSVL